MSEVNKSIMFETMIANFISRNKKGRVRALLKKTKGRNKFRDSLCHEIENAFNVAKLKSIGHSEQNIEKIMELMKVSANDQCYVFTGYGSDLDDKFVSFQEALKEAMGINDAILLVSIDGHKIFVQSESGEGLYFIGLA